jgi:hypothetical protein
MVAGLAIAVGLTSCNGDDSSPNAPPIIPVPNSIQVADVNGDGVPDLLVATTANEGFAQNPGYANVILNSPGSPGTFHTGVHYTTTGTNPSSIAVGDLTGSGFLDLVIAEFGSGSVSVFLHGPTQGTFNPAVDVATGGQPNQVVISDINGDGKPDLVLADMSPSGNVIVLLGNGSGGFQVTTKLATGLITASVAVADLNGDGAPDIVATTFDSSGNNGKVYIFYQDPNNRGSFGTPKIYDAGAQPQSVKIADVNGDGRPDIIVADLGPGADGMGMAGVSVLLQNADGTFAPPVTYATPGQAIDVAVADLTGAGNMDLVVASLDPPNTGSISVLLHDATPGAAAGTFLAATSYPALGQPLSVQIADLNHDGHPDIAVADGPAAGILLQNGATGTFAAEEQVGY